MVELIVEQLAQSIEGRGFQNIRLENKINYPNRTLEGLFIIFGLIKPIPKAFNRDPNRHQR